MGFAQTAREALVLAARRLTIDQQAEPILAGQLGGIGSVLQLDQGISHRRQAERAQRSAVGSISISSPFNGGSRTADVLVDQYRRLGHGWCPVLAMVLQDRGDEL